MGLYHSATPKRHVGLSNSSCIERLNLGKMSKKATQKLKEQTFTTRTYVDRRGRKCFAGTRHLKNTQLQPHLLIEGLAYI